MDIYKNLAWKDQNYFRDSREILFGKTLEEVVLNREKRLPRFQNLLTPLGTSLKNQEFVAGKTPGFSDYIFIGAFQWALSISKFPILNANDSVNFWRKKMLNLYDGLARNAVVNSF